MSKKNRIIVTPAGRRRYMRLLIGHLELQRSEFDSYRIWVNTGNSEDLEFLSQLPKKYNWIELDDRRSADGKSPGIAPHFDACADPNSIYLRLDDDIVYLEPNFLKETFEFRERSPHYFLVFANTVNNAIIDFIHQRLGANRLATPIEYDCCGALGWEHPEIAIQKHTSFLENLTYQRLSKYRFPRWELPTFERVSINAISWLGTEFQAFQGKVGENEEVWLSTDRPLAIRKPNCIFGGPVCAHFSFYPTREVLDASPLLDAYERVLLNAGGTPVDAGNWSSIPTHEPIAPSSRRSL